MEKSSSIKSVTFIEAQRQNRHRRYSINSPNLFESRAGAIARLLKTNSFLSKSNHSFSSVNADLEKYDILSKLNIGAFGASYLIRDSNNGQMYILKRIDYNLPTVFRERLLNERNLLNALKSNYILSLISSYFDKEHHCFSMKFEYISGVTLLHLLRQVRWFEESVVAFYSAQIVLAFEYLHELNIIYVITKKDFLQECVDIFLFLYREILN